MGTGMSIRGVEASSSKTYVQEVRGAIRGCPTDVPLAKAIERRFGELVLRKRGVSAAKNLVAGIRILERLELIPPTITDLHRLQLQAIGKMAKAEDKPTVWATMADFQTLAEQRVHGRMAGHGPGCFSRSEWRSRYASECPTSQSYVRDGWDTRTGWCSSTTKWPRRCAPSPYRRFGSGGGSGFTSTGDPTTTTMRWSCHEGLTRCETSSRSCSRGLNAASQVGTHGSKCGQHA